MGKKCAGSLFDQPFEASLINHISITNKLLFMKKILLVLLIIIQFVGETNSQNIPLYKDSNVAIEKRVDDLLSKMTLDEMVSIISVCL